MSRSARYAVLTPAGRGAIAVVRIEGPRAVEIVDRLFRPLRGKRLLERPVNRIAFGRWGGADGEEVVVCRSDASVEIHCHGGRAAVEAICRSLQESGCERIDAGEWLTRAESDVLRREARLALATAVTERTAGILLDQYNGALRESVRAATAQLDSGDLVGAGDSLQTLLDRWAVGRWLTRPARVVLTGRPNVGKSSLINALVGYERAIVFDAPGTTRDAVGVPTAIDGWPVELVDTAGLRASASSLEQAGIERAEQAVAAADLVLQVEEATKLLGTAADPPARGLHLQIANKIDLVSEGARKQLQEQAETSRSLIVTCATSGEGIPRLLERVADLLAPLPLEPGAAVPFAERHRELLEQAVARISSGHARQAKQALLAMWNQAIYSRKSYG